MYSRNQELQQIGSTPTQCAAKVDKLLGEGRMEMASIGKISVSSSTLCENMNKKYIRLIMSESGKKANKRSNNEKIVIGNLLALTTANAIWAATSAYHGPYIGLIMYALVTYLCWQKEDFRAGVISGTVGLGVHLYELIFMGVGAFTGVEPGYLCINLALPIPLIYFSHKAHQEGKRQVEEIRD